MLKANINRITVWAGTSAAALVILVSSVFAQAEKFDPYLVRAMSKTDVPLAVMVVMNPIMPAAKSYWDEPSPAEVEYNRKKQTLEVQWELRQFVNEWVGTQDFAGDPAIKDYMFLWAANTMVGTISQNLLWQMAQMDSVTSIVLDRRIRLGILVEEEEPVMGMDEYSYGLKKIGIPELRAAHPDLLGTDVVVGILDTGMDATHPELQNKVVAWKDFVDGKEKPYDGNGHGTHVAGTITGDGVTGTQIGIAPRAKLVIGKILSDQGYGQLSWILRGMEWVANPERKLESNLRPRVVNNSWGGSMEADLRKNPFAQAVIAWNELQIFPSFAAGNSGPGKASVGTPGNLPMAFAVAATDESDEAASFSSRGPVEVTDAEGNQELIVKPDIAAPGVKILSSIPDGKYAKFSGTSMATPHVTGAIALLYQVNPTLKIADVVKVLTETADDLGDPGKDNTYGYGRINMPHAVEKLMSMD